MCVCWCGCRCRRGGRSPGKSGLSRASRLQHIQRSLPPLAPPPPIPTHEMVPVQSCGSGTVLWHLGDDPPSLVDKHLNPWAMGHYMPIWVNMGPIRAHVGSDGPHIYRHTPDHKNHYKKPKTIYIYIYYIYNTKTAKRTRWTTHAIIHNKGKTKQKNNCELQEHMFL